MLAVLIENSRAISLPDRGTSGFVYVYSVLVYVYFLCSYESQRYMHKSMDNTEYQSITVFLGVIFIAVSLALALSVIQRGALDPTGGR